jgi:hypothetical protein
MDQKGTASSFNKISKVHADIIVTVFKCSGILTFEDCVIKSAEVEDTSDVNEEIARATTAVNFRLYLYVVHCDML